MSEHLATIHWTRIDVGDGYSRNHAWRVADGLEIPASASPAIVPPPFSDGGRIDPEAGFVASIASCHMLWFLSLAHAQGHVVTRYVDLAVGTLGRNAAGRQRITRIMLSPQLAFADAPPTPDAIDKLHQTAHGRCSLANSVTADIVIESARECGDV